MNEANTAEDLLGNYGFAPVQFCGLGDTLFERHLLFDGIIDPTAAGAENRGNSTAGRSATYCRNGGYRPTAPMIELIRSGSILSRWSS
jgi:hypothetical protein